MVVNLTATNPTADSHLRVWPGGTTSPPDASIINFVNGQTVANLTIARVGPDGSINIFNNSGSVHVIADLVGWYGPPGGATGALFHPTVPYRYLDTRGNYNGGIRAGSPYRSGSPTDQLLRAWYIEPGMPFEKPSALVGTLTVDGATDGSHLTAWPGNTEQPGVSNINFNAGDTIANTMDLPIGYETYCYGPHCEYEYFYSELQFANNTGSVHVISDMNGYFGVEAPG